MPARSLSSSVFAWPDASVVHEALRRWARQVASTRPEVRRIGFFGSYARGDWSVGSDLDVVIVVDAAEKPFERRAVDWDVTDLPVPADVIVYTTEEWRSLDPSSRFARTVREETVWVYEAGGAEINRDLLAAAGQYADLLDAALGNDLVSVVLFGSVARGEASAHSDVDLLVVCEDLPAGRFARLRRLEDVDGRFEPALERLRARGIDTRICPVMKTRPEAERIVPLYLDLVEDARLLRDRGGFFAGVLERLRASLARLGAERRMLGRTRYWVLKAGFAPGEVVEL
jgi:predicted nucleotidyltransferase